MIQSPRGYPLTRDDQAVALADQPMDPHVMRSNIGNDVAFMLDTRGQVKACWAAIGSALTALDADLDGKDGSIDVFSHAETIGPFPLNILPTGQPEPVYVAVDLESSGASAEVFLLAVLRHASQDSLVPSASNPALRDGWNYGWVSTDTGDVESKRLECVSASLEASNPMLGFLQFPRSQWHHRTDMPSASGTVSTCLACIDLYLGRITDGATVGLWGYIVRAAAYGARSE